MPLILFDMRLAAAQKLRYTEKSSNATYPLWSNTFTGPAISAEGLVPDVALGVAAYSVDAAAAVGRCLKSGGRRGDTKTKSRRRRCRRDHGP